MLTKLWQFWCSINYRFCMSEAYLAERRGDGFAKGDWMTRAQKWDREYIMSGRVIWTR